jgi:hypothetical protein
MTEEKQQRKEEESQEKEKRKKKRESQVPLPFCTTAPDPEHTRAYEEDEPCDDARSGKIESTAEQQVATEEEESTHYPHDD